LAIYRFQIPKEHRKLLAPNGNAFRFTQIVDRIIPIAICHHDILEPSGFIIW